MSTIKKILILAANPIDTTRLRLDKEVHEIKNGLLLSRYRDRFRVEQEWAVRYLDLQRALLRYSPNIVHFCGHADEQGIFLEDDNGKATTAGSEILGALFELFRSRIECVVLNACYSSVQAEVISRHIDYVVGMNQEIHDAAAIAFAVSFYDGLGAGRSIDEAFEFGRIAAARRQILAKDAVTLKKREPYFAGKNAETNPFNNRAYRNAKRKPEPPRVSYNSNWYVHRKHEEITAVNALKFSGKPILLLGPKLFGKTTFIQFLLSRQVKNQIITIDLGSFERWDSYEKFLHEFASRLVDEFKGVATWINEAWGRDYGANQKITWLMRERMLPRTPGKLIIAIDRLDAIQPSSPNLNRSYSIGDNFLALLRSWCEKDATDNAWSRLRLILAASSNVIGKLGSPLQNLSEPIILEEFNAAQVSTLAQRYELDWNTDDIERLMRLVGGHPYLVRLVMYESALHGTPLPDLLHYSPQGTIFKNFLDGERHYLEKSGLDAKVRQMLNNGPNLSDEDYRRLHAAGLVVGEVNKNGAIIYRLRYEQLYRRLFM